MLTCNERFKGFYASKNQEKCFQARRTVTSEMNAYCKCNRSFKRKKTLTRHQQTCEMPESEGEYTYEICDKKLNGPEIQQQLTVACL